MLYKLARFNYCVMLLINCKIQKEYDMQWVPLTIFPFKTFQRKLRPTIIRFYQELLHTTIMKLLLSFYSVSNQDIKVYVLSSVQPFQLFPTCIFC